MPRYINKPNITINKFYGTSKREMLNDRSLADDFEDFENEYEYEYDFEDMPCMEKENPYKKYTHTVVNPDPINHRIYHHHTHEVVFNNNPYAEEPENEYDFYDEEEYVLEELPPVPQSQKKYILRRYNQYNR